MPHRKHVKMIRSFVRVMNVELEKLDRLELTPQPNPKKRNRMIPHVKLRLIKGGKG